MIRIKRLTALRMLAISFMLSVMPAMKASPTVDDDRWSVYTAFDCNPVKIIDSDRYTYFQVHQRYYCPEDYGLTFADPIEAILMYDKQNPGDGIRPITLKYQLGGKKLLNAAYNPAGKYLLMVYEEGVVDIVTDNGNLYTLTDLQTSSMPFAGKPCNITFPLNSSDAWIGYDSGFAHIEANASGNGYKVADARVLGKRFRSICPVGDKLMAVVEDNKYDDDGNVISSSRGVFQADPKSRLESFAEFSSIGISDNKLDCIMPVDSKTFAVLKGASITEIKRGDNGSYSTRDAVTDSSLSGQLYNTRFVTGTNNLNYRTYVLSENEHTVIANKSGYLVVSKTHAYNVKKATDNQGHVVVESKKFNIPEPTWVGSSDFSNFWFYEHRKGFKQAHASGSADATSWTYSELIAPNCPVTIDYAQLMYSPAVGMVVSSMDCTPYHLISSGFDSCGPVILSAFKNGEWTNLSPINYRPYFCDENPQLESYINSIALNVRPYPISNSLGACIDEKYPEYFVTSSGFQGFDFINMKNPGGQIMQFVAENYNDHGIPGAKKILPTYGWYTFSLTKPMGCDRDGTFWVYYDTYNNEGINLYYWTADRRKGALENQDVNQGGEWKKLTIPLDGRRFNEHRKAVKALKHPNNGYKLIMAAGEKEKPYGVVDTNGTPDDSSDDSYSFFSKLKDENGAEVLMHTNTYALAEDPVTGKIIAASAFSCYEIDLSKPIVNEVATGRELAITNPDGSTTKVAPSQTIMAIAFDEYNRMWLGGQGSGVKCINADRTAIIGEYNTKNSPIPSDLIFSLCWNPETKEMMISTDRGLASFKPDASPSASAMKSVKPYAWPMVTTPGTESSISLFNAPAGAVVDIYDAEGNVVSHLDCPDGTGIWNLTDIKGVPVAEGVYTLRCQAGSFDPIKVTVLR